MMDWNAKTPFLWDWDNPLLCSGGGGGNNYKLPAGGCSAGVGNTGGSSSGSELGNACSSKSSVSASTDSSSMAAKAPSMLCFEAYRSGSRYLQDAGHAPPSGAQGESRIGLRLGKRTYFEDDAAAAVSGRNSEKVLSPLVAAPEKAPAHALVKKSRASHQSVHGVCCQVDGCNIDLNAAKDYHRKHRVCESHAKSPRVIVAGQERRFCQQCSRFHNLSEFDQKKRSCRKRLSDHNARRRKPQEDIISSDSATAFSLSGYDDTHQINFLWNKTSTPMNLSEPTWENMYDFKLPQTRGPWTTKTGGNNGQLPVLIRQLSSNLPSNCHEVERLLPLMGTTADVLNQGSKTSIGVSNLDGAPDLRRAFSLLSAGSWVSSDSREPSLIQLSDANTSTTRSFMHAANSTSNLWEDGYSLDLQARVVPFTMQNIGGQLQEFQQHKEPYETSHFDLRQMN